MTIEEQEIRDFFDDFHKIQNEIGNTIIGQQDTICNVLSAMIAGGNCLLEGLPGLGKTQLVKTIGKVLDLEFSRIQFTPDLMPADITGTNILVKKQDSSVFEFQKGPIFSNIVLADEINRATPKTQSALLEAMQERTVTVGRNTYALPEPYFVLATQNPLEMDGTYPLPEAQMDRFLLKLDVSFPSKEELYEIVISTTSLEQKQPQKICDGSKILQMRQVANKVLLAKAVGESIMELILKTHPDQKNAPDEVKKYVRYGASPRGAQAILTLSKIYALLDGRYNVSYEDIKKAAYPALRHRLFLNFEAAADGITPDDMIRIIINEEFK